MTGSSHLGIFAALRAIGELFHQASNTKFGESAGEIALTFLAVWLILKPWSVHRFLVFIVVQVVVVADQVPFVPNHLLFVGIVDANILVSAGLLFVWEKQVDGERLVRAMSPPIRMMLIIVYVWAAVHKFNTSYLDPSVSCGALLFQCLATDLGIGLMPTALLPLVVYSSIAIELAIPLALLFRRTRLMGIALGIVFHFLLGLVSYDRYYNFSSLLLALYLLFAPADTPDLLKEVWKRLHLPAVLRRRAARAWLAGTGIVVSIALTASPMLMPFGAYHDAVPAGARVAWIVYGGAVSAAFGAAMTRRRLASKTADNARLTHWSLGIFPLIVLLNGAMPYVGLKTEISFAMFSNLRTEAGTTNHLFMPVRYRVAGFQDDLVSVLASSYRDPERLYMAADGYQMTFFELWRTASRYPDMAVIYVRGGQTFEVPRVGDDPELSRPFPWWQGKLLRFRPVQIEGPVRCIH